MTDEMMMMMEAEMEEMEMEMRAEGPRGGDSGDEHDETRG